MAAIVAASLSSSYLLFFQKGLGTYLGEIKSILERNLLLHAWGAKQQLCEQVLFLLLLRLVRPSVSQVTSYHAHDPNSSSCNTQQQQQQHQQRQQQQQQRQQQRALSHPSEQWQQQQPPPPHRERVNPKRLMSLERKWIRCRWHELLWWWSIYHNN